MADRMSLIEAFAATAGWAGAGISLLAGDASNRRYFRLRWPGSNRTAVLMDAPPEKGEDVRPFLSIAGHLAARRFSAPRILARDEAAGLLLLEDLGDDLYARVLERRPELENDLYSAAIDVLCTLHETAPPAVLQAYDPDRMAEFSALAFEWYLPGATGKPGTPPANRLREELGRLLHRHAAEADVLVLRDYHAENLLWLPERDGVSRVGLLDFQDAMAGHRAYDLVSLLQDARRDVTPAVETAMLSRYIAAAGVDDVPFRTAYAILGAQRNLRIVGVFARLCIRDGKRHYIDLLPRVWGLLMRDLAHDALAPVRALLSETLPAPSPEILNRLKDQCATAPVPS